MAMRSTASILQCINLRDPNMYLEGDITQCWWLQGLGAVMVTRTTELNRLLLMPPVVEQEWTRAKGNWFCG
jgi:hypothetical protein